MELTEKIKNKSYNKSIDSHLLKTYQEYLCLAVLKYACGGEYQSFHHADAPDLQDQNNRVGIEVTQAIEPKDAQTSGEHIRFFESSDKNIRAKSRSKIESNGGMLFENGVLITKTKTAKEIEDTIVGAYTRKCAMIPEYKKNGFQTLGLCIYNQEHLSSDIQKQCFSWLKDAQNESIPQYDFAIIVHFMGVMIFDFNKAEIKSYEIEEDVMDTLGVLARMTAEGEVKEDDPIWL